MLACLALASWLLPAGREAPPVFFAAPRARIDWPSSPDTAETARTEALHRARVWATPTSSSVDFAANPPDPTGTLSEATVRCRYVDGAAHGTTAKFDCVLRDGEIVKVKYGHTGEIHAEVAASRLLTALGFGADRMYLVPHLRCYGCVRTPFYTNWVLDKLHARGFVAGSVPEDLYTDFEWPAVERRFEGLRIETARSEGWGWFELDPVDPTGGATRAERDALRLAAIFLAHWDNKAANQRLVCRAPAPSSAAPCPHPFALIQDLGATFGPNKVELEHWRAAPIWADRSRCTVSMRQFPYGGGTFTDAEISEAGRQLIARELTTFDEGEVRALFSGARFPEFGGARNGDVDAWTATFQDKVRQITEGKPCPTSAP